MSESLVLNDSFALTCGSQFRARVRARQGQDWSAVWPKSGPSLWSQCVTVLNQIVPFMTEICNLGYIHPVFP